MTQQEKLYLDNFTRLIEGLQSIGTDFSLDDVFLIKDVSHNEAKKITIGDLLGEIGTSGVDGRIVKYSTTGQTESILLEDIDGLQIDDDKLLQFNGTFGIGNNLHNQILLGNNSILNVLSDNTTKYATLIGTQNSSLSVGVINSVIIGGLGLIGKTSNTTYVPRLGYATTVNETLIQFTTPTSDRTVTFLDQSGNVILSTGGTFSGAVLANSGIDVTATGGTDILSIGVTNADLISIGRTGGLVNIIADSTIVGGSSYTLGTTRKFKVIDGGTDIVEFGLRQGALDLPTMYLGVIPSPTNYTIAAAGGGITYFNAITNISFLINSAAVYLNISATALTFSESMNIVFGATTGSQLGTATSQKIGKWGVTPIIQPADANQGAIIDNTTGTASFALVDVGLVFNQASINNNFASINRQVAAIRTALIATGEIKGTA